MTRLTAILSNQLQCCTSGRFLDGLQICLIRFEAGRKRASLYLSHRYLPLSTRLIQEPKFISVPPCNSQRVLRAPARGRRSNPTAGSAAALAGRSRAACPARAPYPAAARCSRAHFRSGRVVPLGAPAPSPGGPGLQGTRGVTRTPAGPAEMRGR